MLNENNFDVVVVGAGPSGSASAYWLALSGYKVALKRKLSPEERPVVMV